jgi:hypothetical protein
MGTIFDLAGFGGALAASIISILMVCYGLTIRWIAKGYRGKE